jgi:hypothetical protein
VSLADDLRAVVADRDAVVIAGAGIALLGSGGAATASWRGLLEHGIGRCAEVGALSDELAALSRSQLEIGDLESWLSVAEQITNRLGGPRGGEFRRWLHETVGALQLDPAGEEALEALTGLGVPVATTNYDGLLEAASGLDAVSWRDGARAQRVLRGKEPGIVHLHGYWRDPESVVLGVRSYGAVLGDEPTQAMLHALASMRSLVLVGFGAGLEDPNFGALRTWMASTWSGTEDRHFRLVRESERDAVDGQHAPEERIMTVVYGAAGHELGSFVRGLHAALPVPVSTGQQTRRQEGLSPGTQVTRSAQDERASGGSVQARDFDLGQFKTSGVCRMREANSGDLGVRPAREELAGDDDSFPYVRRTKATELQDCLRRARGCAGVTGVIVYGAEAAGKTRLLFESIADLWGDAWLIAPRPNATPSVL